MCIFIDLIPFLIFFDWAAVPAVAPAAVGVGALRPEPPRANAQEVSEGAQELAAHRIVSMFEVLVDHRKHRFLEGVKPITVKGDPGAAVIPQTVVELPRAKVPDRGVPCVALSHNIVFIGNKCFSWISHNQDCSVILPVY